MFLLIIAGVLCTLIFLMYANWYKYMRSMKGISGPMLYPILGNANRFKGPESVLPELDKLLEKYNKTVRLAFGPHVLVFTSDPKFLNLFLSTSEEIDKSYTYKFTHNWLGYGLLNSGGTQWKQKRKMITPAYHFKILEQFVPVFEKNGDILLENLGKYAGHGSVNVHPLISLYALDVICESAMGTSVNAQRNHKSEYVQSIKKICKIVMDRTFSAHQSIDLLYLFTSNYQIEKRSVKVVGDYSLDVVRSRRAALTGNNTRTSTEVKQKVAFLDLLLKSTVNGEPLSDKDIKDEVETFMFAGHDTTSSAIAFALFALAENPEIQEKILEEQHHVLDSSSKEVTYQDLQEMKYLELVIKETLRLYPPVPAFARQMKNDFKFNDDITFKKGVNIGFAPFITHRDPQLFPDPEKFDPERFSQDNFRKDSAFSYIPFSAGPRNCIGQKFAMLEIKSAISKIIRNYELSPVVPKHKLQLSAELTLQSSNGVLVKLNKRL